jgi:hypothetical protein
MPPSTLEQNIAEINSLSILQESGCVSETELLQLEQQDTTPADLTKLPPFCFNHHFTDAMLMAADVKTVGDYLDTHQGWFTRCAQPMQVKAIGENGYALTIGSFGSFGYIVEPKVGLELLPQEEGVYRIKTIDIPDYTPPGYEVNFNAEMRLIETIEGGQVGTNINWDLDLNVSIQFPKFIYKLSHRLIQGTGNKVLKQIVSQVSRRLTQKVQQDFHGNLGLKIPKR